eukprot:CAMPEP_0184302548 /NCGR_PEP_ID=MMETSP1049-20130417/12495_1 /TAXON_ID=77928 /ORGANISM="Proteomonas sulcata, Strain CCMP704" /LENGTH=97 /DNA_ID=CAMNT_0026613865 /DNA_START=118 /DNA_END=411 /DNA_ORIENTATION=-
MAVNQPNLAVHASVVIKGSEGSPVFVIDLQFITDLAILHRLKGVAVALLSVMVERGLVVGYHLEGVLDGRDRAIDVGQCPVMQELLNRHVHAKVLVP